MKVYFSGGSSFVCFQLHGDEKCVKAMPCGKGGEITVCFDETVSCLKTTVEPFSPRWVMFGCTCHEKESPEKSFSMEMEIKTESELKLFKIISLTIIAGKINTH
jgi:hypothetical protein